MTPPLNRRDFLAQATVATTALAAALDDRTAPRAANLPKSPTDKVTLGKTGIQVSLVGMGTGSVGSGQASNQTRLGVKEFTRVVRHALDRGVCLFDVADQYGTPRLSPRGPEGCPPRQVRDPDQDPRDQVRRRPQPPRTLPDGAGGRLHRHRPAPLHAEGRTGRPRTTGSMEYLDAGQGREDHPRPRHELPRHGPARAPRPRTRSSRSTSPGSIPKG